jgi:hypothetical protein
MECRSNVEVSKRAVEAAVSLSFALREACRSKAAEDVEVDVEGMSKRTNFDMQRTYRRGWAGLGSED